MLSHLIESIAIEFDIDLMWTPIKARRKQLGPDVVRVGGDKKWLLTVQFEVKSRLAIQWLTNCVAAVIERVEADVVVVCLERVSHASARETQYGSYE